MTTPTLSDEQLDAILEMDDMGALEQYINATLEDALIANADNLPDVQMPRMQAQIAFQADMLSRENDLLDDALSANAAIETALIEADDAHALAQTRDALQG